MLQPQQVAARPQTAPIDSLRQEIERRRQSGKAFSLHEVVSIVVPLCTDLVQRHARGERLFVTPSAVVVGANGAQLSSEVASSVPQLAPDHACLAPEQRHGAPGDARSSVFSIGAMVYELLTGQVVGPAMARPTQIVPGLNPNIEMVIGKALVSDRAHRPDDLAALAQALHHFAPTASVPPPTADERHLDQGADFQVDISLSLLPPTQNGQEVSVPRAPNGPTAVHVAGADPYAMPVVQAKAATPVRRADDPTTHLAELKARLESDPRPRYVVVKDGMDHGPFSAVELLQQIGSHHFLGRHVLRDALTSDEKPIGEWEQFALFANHAKLNRDIVAERKAIERVTVQEAKGTRNKMFVGIGILAVIGAGVAAWLLVKRGARKDAIEVAGDDGINVDVAGGLKGEKKKTGARVGTGPGGIPILSGGMSCEQAQARYVEEISIGQAQKQADLTANQLGAVLNNGSYLNACGTPGSMHVNICAAIQNGHAVGVTVTTEPHDGRIASCVAGQIRRMSFPSNPKLDITRTRF